MSTDLETISDLELDADIRLFEEMFSAKARFFDQMVENRGPESTAELRNLRQENVYEIAEFYYLLKIFKVDTPSKLRKFGITHNENIEELLLNKAERNKLGVQPQRLQEALFDTEEKLDRLKMNCNSGKIRMSQSDLGRFVVEYMSFETCRTTVKILSDAGYLENSKSPFGAILIASNGKLEEIFSRYIRSFRKAVMHNL